MVSSFGVRLTPDILVLIKETNMVELGDFFTMYLSSSQNLLYLALGTVVFLGYYFCDKLYAEKFFKTGFSRKSTVAVFALFCLSVCATAYAQLNIYPFIRPQNQSIYYAYGSDSATNLGLCAYWLNQSDKNFDEAVAVTMKAVARPVACQDVDSVDLILVIGESYIKSHAGIYGYRLNTTPCMEQEMNRGNLFAFDDVLSPNYYTSMAVKNIMSTNSVGAGEQWFHSPFFPALFKKAGYRDFLWENQRDWAKTAINSRMTSVLFNVDLARMSYSGSNTRCFEYDEGLISDFCNRLPQLEGRNLIVFHLRGQHFMTDARFPHTPQHVRFHASDIVRKEPYIGPVQKQYIADYDNATLYNDHVIGKNMDSFRQRNAVMIYMSDHGEEVFDYRNNKGRRYNTKDYKNQYKYYNEVPYVVWCSPAYAALHPDRMERIRQSLHVKFMTDVTSQLFFYLGGLKTPYYVPQRNPLLPEFSPVKRLINDHCDYDRLRAQ